MILGLFFFYSWQKGGFIPSESQTATGLVPIPDNGNRSAATTIRGEPHIQGNRPTPRGGSNPRGQVQNVRGRGGNHTMRGGQSYGYSNSDHQWNNNYGYNNRDLRHQYPRDF